MEFHAPDEAFLCGKGGEVMPITSVDDIKLGEEYPGAITAKIAEHYGNTGRECQGEAGLADTSLNSLQFIISPFIVRSPYETFQ